jgi:hypothetical protein
MIWIWKFLENVIFKGGFGQNKVFGVDFWL